MPSYHQWHFQRGYTHSLGLTIVARILIVDDDEADRIVLSTILERAGHETFHAEDGREAVSVYGATDIDVVITDLQMPEVHGLELITLLRGLSPRQAIIAISGTGPDQLEMAQDVGADVTLTKPVDPYELLGAVAMAVSGIEGTRDV